MPSNNHNALISCLSLCFGIICYYLQAVQQIFFPFYREGANTYLLLLAYYKSMSLYLLGYWLFLIPVFYFYLKKSLNHFHRYLLYFLIPGLFSILLWFIELLPRSHQIEGLIIEIIVADILFAYIIGGTFIIALVAVMCDFLMQKIALKWNTVLRRSQ